MKPWSQAFEFIKKEKTRFSCLCTATKYKKLQVFPTKLTHKEQKIEEIPTLNKFNIKKQNYIFYK